MIPAQLEAQIRRLFHADHWPVGTIARQVGVHHATVRRVLQSDGVPLSVIPTRRAKVDPFLPFILDTLKAYPDLHASRLYEMARERGYAGSSGHFRGYVGRHRPRKAAEADLREQAPVTEAGHAGERVACVLLGTVVVLSDHDAGIRRCSAN